MMSALTVSLLMMAGAGSVEPPREARPPQLEQRKTVECPTGVHTSLAALDFATGPDFELTRTAARRAARPKNGRPPCAALA